MIFATVGTQLPFSRLLSALDEWAGRNPQTRVVAQTGAASEHFSHIETVRTLTREAFLDQVRRADLVVAHAGMGSILSAAELGKRVVIMPRRAELGEHRNDHQRDTAEKMGALSNVSVAETADALWARLDAELERASQPQLEEGEASAAPRASDELLRTLRGFVWSQPVRLRRPHFGFGRRAAAPGALQA
jgi:UDP-N-acetylglucosamine transferase subunit ALG13